MANLAAFVKTGKLNDLFVKRGFFEALERTVSKVITPENQEKLQKLLTTVTTSKKNPLNYDQNIQLMILNSFAELIPHLIYTFYPVPQNCSFEKKRGEDFVMYDPDSIATCTDAINITILDHQNKFLRIFFQTLLYLSKNPLMNAVTFAQSNFSNRNLNLLLEPYSSFPNADVFFNKIGDFYGLCRTNPAYISIPVLLLILFCCVIEYKKGIISEAGRKIGILEPSKGVSTIYVKTEDDLKYLDEQCEEFKGFGEKMGFSKEMILEMVPTFYENFKECTELAQLLIGGIKLIQ